MSGTATRDATAMRPCSRYSYFVAASIHVAFALLGSQVSLAQEAATLKPVPHPKFPGVRVAVAQGSTDSKGQNFSVAGLAVSQPVIVYVSESTFARRVRVELADFDDFIVPLHTCQTTPPRLAYSRRVRPGICSFASNHSTRNRRSTSWSCGQGRNRKRRFRVCSGRTAMPPLPGLTLQQHPHFRPERQAPRSR